MAVEFLHFYFSCIAWLILFFGLMSILILKPVDKAMFKINLAILTILNIYTLSLFSGYIETQIANAFGVKCIGVFQVIAVVGFILPLSLLLLKLLMFKPKKEDSDPDKTPGGKTSGAEQIEEDVYEETTTFIIKKTIKKIRKKIKDIFHAVWQVQHECFQNSAENEKVEKDYLSEFKMNECSQVNVDQVANQKVLYDLVDLINLFNLCLDKYIRPFTLREAKPDTSALRDYIYGANSYHWHLLLDYSVTKDRQRAPRLDLVNTNLYTGYNQYGNNHYGNNHKVDRLRSTSRWKGSNKRLAPAKMTAFGGMYTVRGYNEYESENVDPATITFHIAYTAGDFWIDGVRFYEDAEPPTINSISASPDVLWPPNHKVVEVIVTVEAEDNSGQTPMCAVVGVMSNDLNDRNIGVLSGNLIRPLIRKTIGVTLFQRSAYVCMKKGCYTDTRRGLESYAETIYT